MKKFKSYILVAMMGLSVASCKDFLTLMPLNEVVLENYWTEEADVESVLRGAYGALETSDCLVRMAAWGEFRSDNIIAGSDNSGSSEDLNNFIDENINETNELTTYLCFYKTINYANTVLHFAPEVHKMDPNYRGSQLMAHEAEAIAIRSLCYWYLLRAFKDVPYVTLPSIDDTHNFFIGKTPFNEVLDSLIYDLNNIKDYALIHFSQDLSKIANTSRFTRAAIYAMLADMYLWKGDWDKCIECCEVVDSLKMMDYNTLVREKGKTGCNITLFSDKYPLINGADDEDKCGRAYNEIFGSGNSFESLFELPFGSTKSNGFVSSYYNNSNSTGRVNVYSPIGTADQDAPVFKTESDTRFHEDILKSTSGTNNYSVVKYVYQKMDYKLKNGSLTKNSGSEPGTRRSQNSASPNWIVYRYSEVLLMHAEALVMKAKESGFATAADSANGLKEAFNIVKAVNDRAVCANVYKNAPTLDEKKYTTVDDFEKLVFDERRRELLFEGKRWFDLVRQAMRKGNSADLYSAVKGKYEGNTKSIEIKFSNPYGLFLPFNRDEVKINENLVQNPAYQRTDEVIKKSK